jgi:hypothetical protein
MYIYLKLTVIYLIVKFLTLQIPCDKKYNIIQHVKTNLHVDRVKKTKNAVAKQQTITGCVAASSTTRQREFNADLCEAMIKSNIALNKLQNKFFKSFLEKYSNRHIPDESTLRKNYVNSIYKETIEEIKKIVGDNYIWFSVDETIDSCGRYVANFIVGVLNDEIATKGFLISSKQLDKTNAVTISQFITEELARFFLPNVVPKNKLLLMLSDAAPYMVKAASNIKFFYEKLINCTCLAHGINRIAETIRLQFPLVNELVKSGKKIFVKAPLRVQHFKRALPNVSLPPEPVLTRWGTWLDAAVYYANNFQDFKKIVLEFTDTTTKAITDCKDVMQRQELQNNLVFIKANYNFVSKTIEHLEKEQLLLTESIKIIEKFKERIPSVPGKIGEIVKKKNRGNIFKKRRFS